MTQLHKRFSDDQVSFLLHSYSQGLLSRQEVQDTLSIGKTRFFELWKQYQTDPDSFSIAYQRRPNRRISEEVEGAIEKELLRDKELIENPEIPISTYNYSALRDRLRMQGITVCTSTICSTRTSKKEWTVSLRLSICSNWATETNFTWLCFRLSFSIQSVVICCSIGILRIVPIYWPVTPSQEASCRDSCCLLREGDSS